MQASSMSSTMFSIEIREEQSIFGGSFTATTRDSVGTLLHLGSTTLCGGAMTGGVNQRTADNGHALRFPETSRRKAPHRRSCQPEAWALVGIVVKQYIPAPAAVSTVKSSGTTPHLWMQLLLFRSCCRSQDPIFQSGRVLVFGLGSRL
ncbi:hypothetical protein DY000_02061667 [Brassica cretica]|uniref:Uncharacterized protein n=1 Tax=Brassica cretica TaxID=69181 RepID=A0ABQ7B472_BRACR|nr:hypothetical protein DY000_02061667 [Brassica cretica]